MTTWPQRIWLTTVAACALGLATGCGSGRDSGETFREYSAADAQARSDSRGNTDPPETNIRSRPNRGESSTTPTDGSSKPVAQSDSTTDDPPATSDNGGDDPATVAESGTTDPAGSGQPAGNGSGTTNGGSGDSATAGADPTKAGNDSATTKPREIKLLVPERTFSVVGPQDALRVSYDDLDLLKILNMEPVPPDAPKYFPEWLKSLNGRRIRIRGFMYPPELETGLTGFLLARDNQICCFGRNPKPYDIIPVRLREGATTNYIANRPFDVVGVFHLDLAELDGKVFQLYRLDDAIVIAK